MATTPLTLTVLAAVATLATIGMFIEMDAPTQIVVSVAAAIFWGITANAALDVLVAPERTSNTEPVWGIVYVAAILAFATAAFAALFIVETLSSSAGATESGGMLD